MMMFKLIGKKRAAILVVLGLVNLAFAGALVLFLWPMSEAADMDLLSLQAQNSSLQGKLQTIKQDMKTLAENEKYFDQLKAEGYFQTQDRFAAERKLDQLRVQSGLQGFHFSIDDTMDIANVDMDKAGYRLIHSPVTVDNISALLDTDIFAFVTAVDTQFPGHTRIQNFEIRQQDEVSTTLLDAAAKGTRVNLLDAKVSFDWLTMVPKDIQNPGVVQ